jgi:N-acetylmuramoyl-L-alanine amidase
VRSKALAFTPKEGVAEPKLLAPEDAHFTIDDKFVGIRHGESPEDLYRRAQLATNVWKGRGTARAVFFVALHYDSISQAQYRGGLVCYDQRIRPVPKMAQIIARKLGETKLAGQRRADPKPRELGVLNPQHNPVPEAVLIELGTISNASDLRDAQSATWRWRFAKLITDAMVECLQTS